MAKMTNKRLPNLLLVIDRLFIQMNADYGGGVSMLGQLARAMNKLLPGVRQYLLFLFSAPFLNEFDQSKVGRR